MLLGSDVSHYNATPSPKGRSFLFAKASEGSEADSKYDHHAAAARAQGLTVGAYCFGVGGAEVSVRRQVDAFLMIARSADLLALDLERNPSGPSMTPAEASLFLATVHAAGRECGLYHSRSGYPRLGQAWNWVAEYQRTGPLGAPRFLQPRGIAWRFWQYTSTPFDLDAFSGDAADLAALVRNSHRKAA